jgi:hypothetical protein
MLAAAVTLALFGFTLTLVVDVMRRDGAKVLAAMEGRSWTAGPTAGRSVAIRFNPQRTEAILEPKWQPGLRAAA